MLGRTGKEAMLPALSTAHAGLYQRGGIMPARGGFDALADEQAGCDVGMVGELDGAILGGAELSLIKLPEGPLIFHRALTGPI